MVPARASIQRSLICSATSAGVRRIAAPAFVRGATTAQSRAQHSSSRRSAQAAVAPVPQGSAPISSSANTLRVPQSDISLTLHKDSVALHAPSLGLKEPFHFDHVWLRDACQEAESVHPSTKQKLFHTSDVALVEDGKTLLDSSALPELVEGPKADSPQEPHLRMTWSTSYPVRNAFSAALGSLPPPSSQPHVSHYSLSFLLQHALPNAYAATHGDVLGTPRPWAAADLSHFTSYLTSAHCQELSAADASTELAIGALSRPARIPWIALASHESETGAEEGAEVELARKEALYALTEATLRDGFAFVTRLPTEKKGSERGENAASLRTLAEMMGELRHTVYGELWDVRSLASSRNIAYTNLDLGLHMDLLYFQNPPRFQFLHMLRNQVRGGASIFVDSFKVAQRMWDEDRKMWEALAKVPVGFHYVNDGRHYRYTHPTFELAHPTEGHAGGPLPGNSMPRLSAVNYSPPFQSPLPLHPTPHLHTPSDRALFYAALKRFSDLTLDEEFRYERQMQEGECVIFDNRRVLHSRRGFEWNENEKEGEVKRWLKGCYVDGDAIWSTYRSLRSQLGGQLLQ